MTGSLETTVTWLEMAQRPTKAVPHPAAGQMALLPAKQIPLHFYRYLQFRVGRDWNWVSRLRMNDRELEEIVHAQTQEIYVLYLDGAPAGFFELDRSKGDVVDLAYFGLMAWATGRGLGRWFLSNAIYAAWESGPDKVTVNTCTLDHPAALGLYQKLGFVPVRRASGAIEPLADAEILQFSKLW